MADGIKEMVSKTVGLVQKNCAHGESIMANGLAVLSSARFDPLELL